jgi:pimeloyl-ACP methyl ester carboxylesterase
MSDLIVDGHSLSFRALGRGEPVVLLHGGGGSSRQWNALVSALSDRFSCYAPDFYGHGSSPAWPDSRPPSLDDYAAIVGAIADLISEPFHLVGHSHGGAVAITYAA